MSSRHIRASETLIAWLNKFKIYLIKKIHMIRWTLMQLNARQNERTIELTDTSGGSGLVQNRPRER